MQWQLFEKLIQEQSERIQPDDLSENSKLINRLSQPFENIFFSFLQQINTETNHAKTDENLAATLFSVVLGKSSFPIHDKLEQVFIRFYLNFFIEKVFTSFYGKRDSSPYRLDFSYGESEDIFPAACRKVVKRYLDKYTAGIDPLVFRDPLLPGKIYNEILYLFRKHKNQKGQFYTPLDIADELISTGIDFFERKKVFPEKILDPSVGSGFFLVRLMDAMLSSSWPSKWYRSFKNFQNTGSPKEQDKVAGKNAVLGKDIFEISGNNGDISTEENFIKYLFSDVLYFFDIDPVALHLSKTALSFRSGIYNLFPRNAYLQDYLYKKEVQDIHRKQNREAVSWILGNPPWGGEIDKQDVAEIRENYRIANGELNTFSLFLEHSLDLLKEGGLCSFVLPEALLNIRTHAKIRKELLDRSRILKIENLGERFKDVFAPAISLSFEKYFMPHGHKVEFVSYRSRKISKISHSQDKFLHTPHHIFSYQEDDTSESLQRIMEKAKDRLSNHATFYMGIVTGNNKKHIQKEKFSPEAADIIVGKDLSPFLIADSSNWIYFDKSRFQQVCDPAYFRKENKILYKFISNDLRFAIDRKQRYHLNSINGLFLHNEDYSPEYLTALLNSRLVNYYYTRRFFTRRVLSGDLNLIPIADGKSEVREHLEDLVIQIENSSGLPDLSSFQTVQESGKEGDSVDKVDKYEEIKRKIDEIIFDIYRIPNYLRKEILTNQKAG